MSDDHRRYLREQIAMHRKLADVYTGARYAPRYSQVFQRHFNRRIVGLAGLPEGSLVLDFGGGTGIMLPEVLERGLRSVELDLSHDMLRASPAPHRVCADGCVLPFPDAVFDGVLCRGSLHHLPDLAMALAEVRRVLRPGGVLVFSEPSNDSLVNRFARRRMYHGNEEFHEDDEGFRRAEIVPVLEQAGFQVERSRGFGFLAYTLAGFPDKLPVLKYVPGNALITRGLIAADAALEALPVVGRLALHWQLRARKPA